MSDDRAWEADAILADAIACRSCGAQFPVIWGSPFIGRYEAEDVFGLIEIAANARAENAHASTEQITRIEGLLAQYHDADDRDAFRDGCADDFVRAWWFGSRYSEYAAFRTLVDGVELRDREILDVGAGSGYDTARLVAAGARVTALEYNPMLIRRGRAAVPEARWVGGFSHVLPFESATFDVVCCNAALHHMRDVPAAMREMLRVIRRGGHLLTMGDPFRADDYGDDVELTVFDDHPDVLLGVNESIPRFGDLVRALEENESQVEVTLLVTALHAGSPPRRPTAERDDVWSFSERHWMSSASGSVSMKARVRRAIQLRPTTQSAEVLAADEYAQVLEDPDAALRRLVPLLPAAYVDRDFPGSKQSKFELLNGWRKPHRVRGFRTGYKRARWFLTRPDEASVLRFSARSARAGERACVLHTYVSGVLAASVALGREWRDVGAPLDGVEPGARFVCEVRAELDDDEGATFDDFCFDVKDRSFA